MWNTSRRKGSNLRHSLVHCIKYRYSYGDPKSCQYIREGICLAISIFSTQRTWSLTNLRGENGEHNAVKLWKLGQGRISALQIPQTVEGIVGRVFSMWNTARTNCSTLVFNFSFFSKNSFLFHNGENQRHLIFIQSFSLEYHSI